MHAFNTIAPIFLVVFLGWMLHRNGFLALEFFRGMNKLTFWVALPSLLFHKIAVARSMDPQAIPVFFVLLAGMVGCLGLGAISARFGRLPPPVAASFIQAAFRGNLAYVGLPVVMYGLAKVGGRPSDSLETLAILAIVRS